MNKTISERLSALRKKMAENSIDMYYIPTDDFHGSEYVSDYFKCREYISGFDGSAGTAVITQTHAGLWTDGRYFIQAEKQLSGTDFTLYKSGNEGVPTAAEYINKNIGSGTLGFDGRVVSAGFVKKIPDVKIRPDVDLVGEIWENRPPLPCTAVSELDISFSGKSRQDKISEIRSLMTEKKADICLLTALDDICWLLNMRGKDIDYNPVVLCYLALTQNEVHLFTDHTDIDFLNDVTIHPYNDFYSYISGISPEKSIYADISGINLSAYSAIPKDCKIINGEDLTKLPKAIKNPVETENMRKAHIKDGVAVTKFIYEIKNNPEKYTELSAARLIISLRKQQENYIEESFEPITAYGSHGAIVHYSASPETDIPLKAEGFFLCDTGGHYLEGTTDITRTICLGAPTPDMKLYYTSVLKGHLALASAVFPHGCKGVNLDILARKPLWNMNMNYNHGTGHGVGYLLNVHEGPNGIRMRTTSNDCVLEEGMITSNEPGLYLENRYGIRIENLILCRKHTKNDFGQFMRFDTLTVVPYDPDAVDPEFMSEGELSLYNIYQAHVYNTLSPYLTEKEREWLKNETRYLFHK